jgi:uncharacterized membrane protein
LRGLNAAAVGLALALGGVLFSGYLLAAQLFLIHAVCQWCLASDIVVSAIAVLAWARHVLVQRATGMPQRRTRDLRSELPHQPGWPS